MLVYQLSTLSNPTNTVSAKEHKAAQLEHDERRTLVFWSTVRMRFWNRLQDASIHLQRDRSHMKNHACYTCSPAEVEGVPLYKARPDNEVEKAACTRELTKEEINKLVVGPKVRRCMISTSAPRCMISTGAPR